MFSIVLAWCLPPCWTVIRNAHHMNKCLCVCSKTKWAPWRVLTWPSTHVYTLSLCAWEQNVYSCCFSYSSQPPPTGSADQKTLLFCSKVLALRTLAVSCHFYSDKVPSASGARACAWYRRSFFLAVSCVLFYLSWVSVYSRSAIDSRTKTKPLQSRMIHTSFWSWVFMGVLLHCQAGTNTCMRCVFIFHVDYVSNSLVFCFCFFPRTLKFCTIV